jgi:hypothetical protein
MTSVEPEATANAALSMTEDVRPPSAEQELASDTLQSNDVIELQAFLEVRLLI